MRELITANNSSYISKISHPYIRTYISLLLIILIAFSSNVLQFLAISIILFFIASFSGIGKLRWFLSVVPAVSTTVFFIVTALIVGTKISEIAFSESIIFALKIMLTYMCAASLFATTNYYDIVKAYEYIKVPVLITSITAFIFRWFLLISEEANRMNTARIVRGGSFRKTKDKLKDIIQMSISLIIRSYYRSERIAAAMECRGFQGKLFRGKHQQISKNQFFLFFLFLLFFFFIMVLGR